MWYQQIFVALLSLCLALQHVTSVVNNGQTQKIEKSENKDEKSKPDKTDLVAESSESSNRREASIFNSYGAPPGRENIQLPVPVYGIPNTPSNNIVYPAPPPDIPPPPPKISSPPLYGPPSFGKTFGLPQINHLTPISKGHGGPFSTKFGSQQYSGNKFSSNLSPPKPVYGPPKIKYNTYPFKNLGSRPPKPIYGPPIGFKDNFNYNRLNINNNNLNNLYASNLFTNNAFSTNSFSNNLYSGISSLSHQYGAPVLSSKPTISLQYGTPNSEISSQYGVPNKLVTSGPPIAAYGPPQPSKNPQPPHPGAPAPPTPPDIKYDGWQPIPGLVSKRPIEETKYQNLPLTPPLNNDIGVPYRAPPVTLDISHGNSLLNQPGLSDSYGVPLNAVTGSNGMSDSYNAPLGTVTGSGGVVASSGAEAHAAQYNSHSSSHSSTPISTSQGFNFDSSSLGIGHEPDIKTVKSIKYDISPHPGISVSIEESSNKVSGSYSAPEVGALSGGSLHTSGQLYNSFGSSSQSLKGGFNLNSHKSSSLSSAPVGLIPPSGVYGAPPNSQFGTPLFTNTHHGSYTPSNRPELHTNTEKHSGSLGSSYLPPSPPVPPSYSYGVPSSNIAAISYQNVVHGSSTAEVGLQKSLINIDGVRALPLSSYNVPLAAIDGSYSLSSAHGDNTVSLDYSHPPVSIDLTQHDCNQQPLQVSSLAYNVPSANSYTSSISSHSTNIETSHKQTVPQSSYGVPAVPSFQYGVPDLLHSSSEKAEAKSNNIGTNNDDNATHGKNYGKAVAESFGPNSELVESQSIDLNNIPLQGSLGSYTLQIQSAEGGNNQVAHSQVLNEGLLQSILKAIEQPGKQNENSKYPIILQPYVEQNSDPLESNQQASEISEVKIEPPKENILDDKSHDDNDNEETLQLLDTSNIALYYKKDDGMKKIENDEKTDDNSVE